MDDGPFKREVAIDPDVENLFRFGSNDQKKKINEQI